VVEDVTAVVALLGQLRGVELAVELDGVAGGGAWIGGARGDRRTLGGRICGNLLSSCTGIRRPEVFWHRKQD
jgi:hypothetical protein